MALQQTITQSNGMVSTYWKITEYNWDKINTQVGETLSGYADQTHRESNCSANILDSRFFTLPQPITSSPITEAYDAIKLTAEFTGSTDV